MPALTTPRVGGGQCLWVEAGRTSELATRTLVSRRDLRISFRSGRNAGRAGFPAQSHATSVPEAIPTLRHPMAVRAPAESELARGSGAPARGASCTP